MRLYPITFIFGTLIFPPPGGADGMRVTFDPHNLDHAVIDIDLVKQCNQKTECTVDVLPGVVLKIKSMIDATVAFSRRNDYSASGMVSQHVPDAELPANPCIDSPFPIRNFYWAPEFRTRGKSPSGWKLETSQFTGVSRSGFAFMEVPGSPLHFCLAPRVHRVKDDPGPKFAVLSVRLDAILGKQPGSIAFSETMHRATQILADRVEDAISNAGIIEDDDENLNPEAMPQLRLLVSALSGLRIALNPPASGSMPDYPSSADDGIRRAVHVAVQAWSYVLPYLAATKAEEKPTPHGRRAAGTIRKTVAIAHAFNSSLRWLNADMEAIRVIYGESESRNYGKSQFIVPLAELLLAQLDRLRGAAANDITGEHAESQDIFEWLSATQEQIIELRDGAFNSGDDSAAISTDILPRLSIVWNMQSTQLKIGQVWASPAKEDLRIFLAFLDTLKRLPSARKIEFKRPAIAGDLAPLGNGDQARCSIDPDGEYCYVDLLTNCQGRMACSTKLSFNGHWVAESSRTGMLKASRDLGGWVRGEETPVVKAGAMMPANSEVCSDLSIVAVLYRPTDPKDRWTRESGGVISGRTRSQPELETVYPQEGRHDLSSNCIVLDAGSEEGSYIIQSVRLKIDLEKERTTLLNTLMINAAARLKQDLQEASRVAKDHESLLSGQAAEIRQYRLATDRLIKELDKSLFRYVNMPVTLPEVRVAATNLYVKANLLASASIGDELVARGFVTSVKQVINQLSGGFGFSPGSLSPPELPEEKRSSLPSQEGAVKSLKDMVAFHKLYQRVLPSRYQGAIGDDLGALSSLLRALEASPKLKHGYDAAPYRTAQPVKDCAPKAIAAVGSLIALMQKYPRDRGLDIKRFTTDQIYLVETFLPGEGPVSGRRVAPLVSVLDFAVGEATRRLALKWSDPLYVGAYRVQSLLRDELLPLAYGVNGDEAAARSLPKLGELWASSEFQLFLGRVGKSGNDIEAIVQQIQATLGVNLANLGVILPAGN
jgi:hypothetical protein